MNEHIKVMVNGLPGNMASQVAKHVYWDFRFDLIPYSFTGPEITATDFTVGEKEIKLVRPDQREQTIATIQASEWKFISVDFTQPSAVNSNAEFYCTHGLPFVMGTTGGDRKKLQEIVGNYQVAAVIAPNMAKQVVGFQAMMEYAAETFPGLFAGYSLDIRESHQQGKADTSGTAKAMVEYFKKLGVQLPEDFKIDMERRPDVQWTRWGIPEKYLSGHGWHTYTLVSPNETVKLEFTHNVNGRDVYAKGALDAVVFLDKKVKEGVRGKVFTMVDVLKG